MLDVRCKPYFILFSVVLVLCQLNASGQDTLPLQNAYYISKTINNFPQYPKDQREKMLGAIYWYSKNDLDTIRNTSEFWDSLRKYKILHREAALITRSIYPKVDLVQVSAGQVTTCLKGEQDTRRAAAITEFRNRILAIQKKIDPEGHWDSLINDCRERTDSLRQLLSSGDTTIAVDTTALLLVIQANEEEIKKNTSMGILNRERIDSLRSSVQELNRIADSLSAQSIQCYNKGVVEETAIGQRVDLSDVGEKYAEVVYSDQVRRQSESQSMAFRLPTQSQVYDAMAIYLVKRVKQESIMWFFEQLRKNMDAYQLVKDCFPGCIALLQSNEIYEAPKMGSLWRYAITKDYATMPEHLFNSKWLERRLIKHKAILEGLKTSWSLSRLISQNYSFSDAITALYTSQQVQINNPEAGFDLNNIVTLFFAINQELRNSRDGKRLQFSDLMAMTDKEFEMMISLVDMKYGHVMRNLILASQSQIDIGSTKHLNVIRKWLGSILLAMQQFENIKMQYQQYIENKKQNGDLQFQYDEYNVWTSLKAIMNAVDIKDAHPDPTVFRVFDARTSSVIDAMGQVQEVYRLLENKNFAGSVSLLFDVTRRLIPAEDTLALSKDELMKYLKTTRLNYYSDVVNNTTDTFIQKSFGYQLSVDGDSAFVYPSGLLGYLFKADDTKALAVIRQVSGFLNDVAYTRDSKQLAQVIEAYAMPPGSYKLKRGSWFSLDINAYVGAYGGIEWIKVNDTSKAARVYGLTAPIGIAYSKTFGRKLKALDTASLGRQFEGHPDQLKIGRNHFWQQSSTTLTLFFSIIDIGSVVSYRFTDQDGGLPQEVKWAQVFSPGVHLNWGIKNTPLVFAVGCQYTPQLRKISSTLVDYQSNAIRAYAGFKFDLPLFNLKFNSDNNVQYRLKKSAKQ